jgi:molecular chaperone GrpE
LLKSFLKKKMSEPNVSELPAEEKPPVESVTSVDLTAEVAVLTAERDKIAAEKAELEELLRRRQAEFDNFRRRTERERADVVQYAGMETVKAILPIVDDFERALQADASCKDYAKGIELIHGRLTETLKKLGLEPIEAQGKAFDPHLHQAVEKVQTDEVEDHTILSEFQKGYFFKGKLLRPSMVKVAVRP